MSSNIFLKLFIAGLLTICSANARTFEGIPGFGRNLIVRSLPPIPDFQSNLYEVYMEPLLFDPTKPPLQAVVVLAGEGEGIQGELTLSQWTPGGPVLVQGNVSGLAPGPHGLHVARRGDLREGCKSTGKHFNPYLHRHGGPRDPIRHLGDLGNIKAGEDGVAKIKIVDPLISLSGPRSVAGRALSLSSSEDDLGRAGTEDSALDGSSGMSIACGIIGLIS
ncbi:superoxide dismutase [Cu-Zn]-like isoform X2 [Arctopsyche grandis]|uniref:superoxide dismutase [Cu-Zn]-like isoform X2 n=1 Tax=Arctopsyche grandis TaxID=121162 RepID=UPI00406D6D43